MVKGTSQGKQATSTGAIEQSPERRKRQANRRRNQEARWAAKSGAVTTRQMTNDERARLLGGA